MDVSIYMVNGSMTYRRGDQRVVVLPKSKLHLFQWKSSTYGWTSTEFDGPDTVAFIKDVERILAEATAEEVAATLIELDAAEKDLLEGVIAVASAPDRYEYNFTYFRDGEFITIQRTWATNSKEAWKEAVLLCDDFDEVKLVSATVVM